MNACDALNQALAAPDPQIVAAALEKLRHDWPHWDEPAVRLGEWHRGRGDLLAARTCYEDALARNHQRVEALLALGAMHVAAGRAADAEPLLSRCCNLAPRDGDARHAWGLALLLQDRAADACIVLEAAHALDPYNDLCAVHLADAAHAGGRAEPVLAMLEASWRRDALNIAALTGQAALLAHLGRRTEALDRLEAATLLNPNAAVPVAMFADMLARGTRQVEAERALRRAIALDPGNHDAAMALSVVLMRLHRYREAVALLRDLLDRGVDRLGPLCNMTTALVALGRGNEAVACAREAIALGPTHPAPRRALCNALPYQDGVTGAALLAAARACAQLQPRLPHPIFANDADLHKKLRIGLLSGTLRMHPVGWLTIAGFEHLDPARHEIVCLTPNPPEDAIGHRFAKLAASWHDTGSLNDAALAERGRALGIDVLIDLGGYGDFGRLAACAHRAAPVQIKWVGMQNHSTGLSEMDWFISDRWETPAGFEDLYSEKLLILRDGYICYAPPEHAPPVAPAPALLRGHVSFGCYNNLAKLTAATIFAWARILHRVPNARLVLKTHQFNDAACRADLHADFAAHGIAAKRVVLRGSSPHRTLLEHYAEIDIVLDPFAYSGGLTTCEALWMGVPTLTLPGETFASRHSTSHMSNVGLKDWVVADQEAYVAQAVHRAANLPALAELRAGLRPRMRASPLCDAPRFGASLQAALRHAWQDWCRTPAAGASRS